MKRRLKYATLTLAVLVSMNQSCTDDEQGAGGGLGIARGAVTQCVTFQRGVNGTVNDVEVASNQGSWQMGAQVNLHTGKTSGGATQRSLVKFDLSSIPSTATVTSADVTLYVGSPSATNMKAHKVLASWNEVNPGGALWSNQPGYVTDATIGTLSRSAGSYDYGTFSVLSQVQTWVNGTDPNYGMVLEDDANTATTTYTASDGSASKRPKLVVCYDTGGTTVASSTAISTATASSTAESSSASTSEASSSAASTTASSTASSSSSSATSSSSVSTGVGGGTSVITKIAVIGDYGAEGGGLTSVANMVKGWNPDQVLTTGDNVYSSASGAYDTIIGQNYHDFIYPYTGAYGSGSPTGLNRFWPVPGNHDWNNTSANPLSLYLNFFTLPTNGGSERYYHTFLDANQRIHLFALDADSREPNGKTSSSTQGQWLQAAMSADTTSCFKVVTEHEPPHCSTIGSSEGADSAMDWPYHAWGADVVLSGSRHGYERLSVSGFPFIVNGLGGGALWGDWNVIDPNSVYRFPTTPQRYGAQLITVTIGNGTATLLSEFYAVGDTTPSDSYTITKSCD